MFDVVPFVLLAGQFVPGNEFIFSVVLAGIYVFHKYYYLFVVSEQDPDCYACRCAASKLKGVFCKVVVGGV